MALLARHGDTYKQVLMSQAARKRNRALSVPPLGSETPDNTNYQPQSYAVKTAGSIQDGDWSPPRVIRNVMPSPEAKVLKAKVNASKVLSLSSGGRFQLILLSRCSLTWYVYAAGICEF